MVLYTCFQHSEGIGRKREASLIYINNSRPTWVYNKTLSWKESKAKNENKVNQSKIKQIKKQTKTKTMKSNSCFLQAYLKFKHLNIHDKEPISGNLFSDVRSSHRAKADLELAPRVEGWADAWCFLICLCCCTETLIFSPKSAYLQSSSRRASKMGNIVLPFKSNSAEKISERNFPGNKK